jgi:hypothetical protein
MVVGLSHGGKLVFEGFKGPLKQIYFFGPLGGDIKGPLLLVFKIIEGLTL